MNQDLRFRGATTEDVGLILSFIYELAAYEQLAHQVTATEEDLLSSLFGQHACAQVVFVESAGQPIAFAAFFYYFSTFTGRPDLYLEDLYVKPNARGQGIGTHLLFHLAGLAKARNCAAIRGWVLDSNQSAIDLYRHLGAIPVAGGTVFKARLEELNLP